jgi:hypothetical protein
VAVRGILTRINPEGLKALRQLALDRDTTVQALMIEAANDLLRKYRGAVRLRGGAARLRRGQAGG